eukprot:226895_1
MSRLYIVILITLYVSRCKCMSRDSPDDELPEYVGPPDYTQGAPPPDSGDDDLPDIVPRAQAAPRPDSMELHEDIPPYDSLNEKPEFERLPSLPVYDEKEKLISDHAGAKYLGRVVDHKCGHTVDLYSKLNEAIKRQCHEYVTNHLHKLSRELGCPNLHAMLTKHLAALHPHERVDDLSRG